MGLICFFPTAAVTLALRSSAEAAQVGPPALNRVHAVAVEPQDGRIRIQVKMASAPAALLEGTTDMEADAKSMLRGERTAATANRPLKYVCEALKDRMYQISERRLSVEARTAKAAAYTTLPARQRQDSVRVRLQG